MANITSVFEFFERIKMKREKIIKLVLSAMLLGAGIVLPLLTSQIKEIGDSLLPMHFVVFLCGLLCGGAYGGAVGFILPLLRSFIFSMPPLYPNAVWMALELTTYGFISGFLYSKSNKQNLKTIYASLITAMLAGRVVWGVSKAILLCIGGKAFSFAMFIAGGFVDAVPGIIIQLILIPQIINIITNVNKKTNKK